MIVETLPRLWRVGFAIGLGASGLLPRDHTALGVWSTPGAQSDMCIFPSNLRIFRWYVIRGMDVPNSSAMSRTWQLFLCSKKLRISCLVSISVADSVANGSVTASIADGCLATNSKYLCGASGVGASKR